MSTLNLRLSGPPQVLNLTVDSGLKAASLTWDAVPFASAYEVWANTDDDLSTATLFATVNSSTFTPAGVTVRTFFWVRAVNGLGVYGPFSENNSDLRLGSNLSGVFLNLYEEPTFAYALTQSVQNVKARAYYTNSDGTTGDTGLVDFTSTVTQSSSGVTAWGSPDNARVDDSSYATWTTSSSFSESLLFDLGDLGVPSTSLVDGIQFQVKGKSTFVGFDNLYAYVGDNTGHINYAKVIQFPQYATDNVDDTVSVGGPTELWGLQRTGAVYIPSGITSADTTQSAPTSISSSVGSSSSSPTVSAYNTWYSPAYGSFTATDNSVVAISMYELLNVGTVTGTGNILCWARSRLYDVTLSADVPGATNQFLFYYSSGFGTTGTTSYIHNANVSYAAGFRGLLIPGHTYRVYVEAMKQQTGTAAVTLTINGGAVSASSAASI